MRIKLENALNMLLAYNKHSVDFLLSQNEQVASIIIE